MAPPRLLPSASSSECLEESECLGDVLGLPLGDFSFDPWRLRPFGLVGCDNMALWGRSLAHPPLCVKPRG